MSINNLENLFTEYFVLIFIKIGFLIDINFYLKII